MDLGSVLNNGQEPTDLEQDAISTYRRLSSGSTNLSPVPPPHLKLPTTRQPDFQTPDLPGATSDMPSPSLKRKINQVDPDGQSDGNGKSPVKRSQQPDQVQKKEETVAPESSPAPAARIVPQQVRNRLDQAYTGQRPLDELSMMVKSALMHYLTIDQRTYGKLGLEIEAKLGTITDRDSGRRFNDLFPIHSPVLLHPDFSDLRFTSNMTEEQHAKFNKHLNDQVELRNPKHPDFDPSRPVMKYIHTKLTDSIYETYRSDGTDIKPRVTTNDKDGSVVETISKESITHLHICCPTSAFDVRLSINLEHQIPVPTNGANPIHERQKDRLSYRLPTHQIDLTKVAAKNSSSVGGAVGAGGGKSYELEVEMTGVENLKRQAELEFDGRGSTFDEILSGFMGTIVTLNRIASSF